MGARTHILLARLAFAGWRRRAAGLYLDLYGHRTPVRNAATGSFEYTYIDNAADDRHKDWRRRFSYPVIFPLRTLPFCSARVAGPQAPRVHVRNQYGANWADAVDFADNRLLKTWTCRINHAPSWTALLLGGGGTASSA